MRFLRRPQAGSRSIAIFCGAFHPPTIAHLALADAARERVDEVLWVMPETFPHKQYDRVSLLQRLRLVLEVSADPVAVASESLFFSIAAEAEATLAGCKIHLLIGEDGARRIVEWDYGLDTARHALFLEENFLKYPLLSSRRQDDWALPEGLQGCVEWLPIKAMHGSISSTVVRQRIAEGQDWTDLVPKSIHKKVAEFYGSVGMASGQ